MRVEIASPPLADVEADLHVICAFDGQDLPKPWRDVPGAGDVRTGFKKQTLLRPGAPARLLVTGLGERDELTAERVRVAGALAEREGRRYEAATLAWEMPEGADPALAGALVEGAVLGSFSFERFRSRDPDDPEPSALERLVIVAPDEQRAEADGAAEVARVASEAANRARELQSLPANVLTPSALAERAEELAAAHKKVSVETLDRAQIKAAGMGGLAGVSRGSAEEPRLITLRYDGGGSGPRLGLVGKAVTFDAGGISIKPAARMDEMKMDMSGGATVIEAVGAFAELGLPLDVVAVVPATENMPGGRALKPGDIITQLNGRTVEVRDTDAEGRLILADALAHCVAQGAERILDLATLTGAVVVALGSTYAALISNDDAWAEQVSGAAERSGELAWRLPLHEEYKQLIKGTDADLANVSLKRKAGTIYAASYLEEFVAAVPWAHLDIAGTAWDVGREYVGKGPNGYGVRLLVDLARELAG